MDVSRQLEIVAMSKEEIGRSVQLVNEQARSILMFALKWNDLQDHLDTITKSIEEKGIELDSKLKLLKERESVVESKEGQLASVNAELESNVKDLGCVRSGLEEFKVEIQGKKRELGSVQKRIEECRFEYLAKKGELDALRKSTLEWTDKVTSKREELSLVEALIEKFAEEREGLRKSISDCNEQLVLRKSQLGQIENLIESKEKQLRLVEDSLEKLSNEHTAEQPALDLVRLQFLNNVNEKEQHLNALENSLKEGMHELGVKKAQFEDRVKEFELKEKHLNSMQKAFEEKCKRLEMKENSIRHPQATMEQPESSAIVLGCADQLPVNQVHPLQIKTEQSEDIPISNTIGSPSENQLQLIIATEGRRHGLMHSEQSATLSLSPDPAKFVLDLIQESYSDNQKKGGTTDIEEGFIKDYILHLERLKEVRGEIMPQVKEQAMELASKWKSTMRAVTENSFEVLGFLQLLATYDLVTFFNIEEIIQLLFTVAHLKQAPEICRDLGFVNMVPDFVRNLIRRNQLLEAVRFICAFKLMDFISPVDVALQYVNNIRNTASNMLHEDGNNILHTKEKKLGFEITSLRALIECIEDCKLESFAMTEEIRDCIVELEREKAELNPFVSDSNPMTPMQLQGQNCNFGASTSDNQPASGPGNELQQQNSCKCARTDEWAVTNYTPQVPALVNPSTSSPGGVAANRGQGVQQAGTGDTSSPVRRGRGRGRGRGSGRSRGRGSGRGRAQWSGNVPYFI